MSCRALKRYGGIDPAKAELIVGTSAGSVVAAQLRSGWTTSELWDFAMGVHPLAAHAAVDEADRRSMFTPGWASPFELARRTVGATFVLGRSLNRFPMPQLPSVLGRLYPGGLFTMAEGRRRLEHTIAGVAHGPDVARRRRHRVGQRVVLGRPGSPRTTLRRAVLASCAIPGVYEPVRVGACTWWSGARTRARTSISPLRWTAASTS